MRASGVRKVGEEAIMFLVVGCLGGQADVDVFVCLQSVRIYYNAARCPDHKGSSLHSATHQNFDAEGSLQSLWTLQRI